MHQVHQVLGSPTTCLGSGFSEHMKILYCLVLYMQSGGRHLNGCLVHVQAITVHNPVPVRRECHAVFQLQQHLRAFRASTHAVTILLASTAAQRGVYVLVTSVKA